MPGVIRCADGDFVPPPNATPRGVVGPTMPTKQIFCTAEGFNIAILGEKIASHGDPPHNNATMSTASNFARIGGIGICAQGDLATCGSAAGPGSTVVFVGVSSSNIWDDTFTWDDSGTWTD